MYTAKIFKILKIFDLLPFSTEHEKYSNKQPSKQTNKQKQK